MSCRWQPVIPEVKITSPFEIILTDTETSTPTRWGNAHTTEARIMLRARIVLASANAESNVHIAARARGGTLAYFAAYDVHRARVAGRIEESTGIAPLGKLVDQVMTQEPYASADRVFWVIYNGSSHAGQTSIDRMQAAWPNAHLIHQPVHASWLNQVQIYSSILQRKAISPADFDDLDDLAHPVMAFQDRYNQNASPFN